MRFSRGIVGWALGVSLMSAACLSEGVPPPSGPELELQVSPLTLPDVSDACFSFRIANGLGQTVVARGRAIGGAVAGGGGDGGPVGLAGSAADPLCSTQFGNGQGALSYVAPCDADAPAHTVTLWVNSVCAGGSGWEAGCTPMEGFVNPCGAEGCSVTATCVENADVPVTFNLTVMAAAKQGFFDIAVNFDSVFCSAKLDTCSGSTFPDDANLLLHDATGARAHTAVAAVTCSVGPDADTVLHLTPFQVICGATTYTLDLAGLSAEGVLEIPASPAGPPLDAAVFFGTTGEGAARSVYTNVAFLVPDVPCTVSWTVVPSDSAVGPQPSNAGAFGNVAAVVFDPALATVTPDDCDQHGLNGGGGVSTAYLEDDLTYTACLETDASAFCEVPRPFVMRVRTDLAGTSGSNQFTIPTTGPGYAYSVVTSDGQTIEGLTGSTTLTFPAPGEYTIEIWGDFPRIFFNNVGDKLKLLEVLDWGSGAWTSMEGAFHGCENAVAYPSGGDFTLVTSFRNAWALNKGLTSFPTIDTSAGSIFSEAWRETGLTTFPALNLENGTAFTNTWARSPLVTFPLVNMPKATNVSGAWSHTSLTAFPPIQLPAAQLLLNAWYSAPLETFPEIDLEAATDLRFAWYNCKIVEFPPIDFPNGTDFDAAWYNNGMTSFPNVNMDSAVSVPSAWGNNRLTSFPAIAFPNGRVFAWAWVNNRLTDFPAIDFPLGENFQQAWDGNLLDSFPAIEMPIATNLRRAWRNNGTIASFGVRTFGAVTDGFEAFVGTTLATSDYSAILVAIEASTPNDGIAFHGGSSLYDTSATTARANLVSRGWGITDGGPAP